MHHLLIAKHTLLLMLAVHGAATLDAYSTYRMMHAQLCCGAQLAERNPLMRPFAGNASIFIAVQPDALVADYMLLRHPHSKLSDSIAIGIAAEHLALAVHNFRLTRRYEHEYPIGDLKLEIPDSRFQIVHAARR